MSIKLAFIGKMHSGKTTALKYLEIKMLELLHRRPYTLSFATTMYKMQECVVSSKEKNREFLQDARAIHDRDFNASLNIKKEGLKLLAA